MKKKLLYLLTFVLTFTIGLNTISCTSNQAASQTHSPSPQIEYVIYYSCTEDENNSVIPSDLTVSNVKFKSSSEMDFALIKRVAVENKKNPSDKILKLNGTTINIPYNNSYATSLASCVKDELKAYGLVDQYQSSSGTIVEYRQDTQVLLFYSDLLAQAGTGEYTPQKATADAAELMETIYGADAVANYTFVRTSESDDGFIYVYYTRTINGYPTVDTVRIQYKRNGDVNGINALKMGIFDPISHTITAEKIKNAEAKLRSSISKSWILDDQTKVLVMGSDGKCYLQILGTQDHLNEDTLESSMESFYINID